MHVFILTLGTRGDFELFLLLGRELHRRGHRVVLGTSPFYADGVRGAGLECAAIGDGTREELLAVLKSLRGISDRTQRIWQYFQQWVYPQFMKGKDRIQALAEEADYFISNLKTVLRRRGEAIPGAFVTYDPPLDLEDLRAFGAGVPSARILDLVAMNKPLLDPQDQWGRQFHFTGFWRDEEAFPWREPPAGLLAFLKAGPPPAVLTMGSMVTFDPGELAATFREALRRAGQRGILVGGWAGVAAAPAPEPPPLFYFGGSRVQAPLLEPADPVFCVEEAPYDWLFPQASCVLHHGGCGTVGAVLRAGKPSILLPQIMPQQLFGTILGRAGVAAGMFEAQGLNAADLADALRRAAGDPQYQQQGRHWQQVLAQDRGVREAADRIEAHGRQLAGAAAAPAPIPALTPPAAVASYVAAPSATDGRRPKLVFVLSNDFGELSTAVFFMLGQPFDVLFLLPSKQADMGNSLPAAAQPYGSVADVFAAVEREKPDLVLLCSAYLYYPNNIFTMEELAQLVQGLRARSYPVLTSDPFLGVLARVDENTFNADPQERKVLAERFSEVHQILKLLPHLYWVDPQKCAATVSAEGFSLAKLVGAPAYMPCRLELLTEIGADPGRKRWLFVLAGEDYWMQAMTSGGPVFDDWLTDWLRETVHNGRQPVLLAPYACTSAVTLRTPRIDGLVLLNHCRHDQFLSLLLEAEYAFYWNIFSNSTLVRAVNRLPVFFFDPGHMARYSTPLYRQGVNCYFGGQEPSYLKITAPLGGDALAQLLPEQERTMERMAGCVLAPPSPAEVVQRLLCEKMAAARG